MEKRDTGLYGKMGYEMKIQWTVNYGKRKLFLG